MTEDEARTWIKDRHGGTALIKLERLVDIVTKEAQRQNLIAPSTLDTIWNRHIVDSAQLLAPILPLTSSHQWVDIGSGAGFPGLVIAALTDCRVILVEPRKRRAAFLEETAKVLALASTSVKCGRIEGMTIQASVISARAVAPLTTLFTWAEASATTMTQWILPKGRSAREEVETAQQAWHGVFHVEHSITDPESLIVLASGVKRR